MSEQEQGVMLRETEIPAWVKDIAVIRPPLDYDAKNLAQITSALQTRAFYPVLLPDLESDYYTSERRRWYPTDSFREVDKYIVVNWESELDQVIKYLNQKESRAKMDQVLQRKRAVPFKGGDFVHNKKHKVLVYSYDQLHESAIRDPEVRAKQNQEFATARSALVHDLSSQGWNLVPVATGAIRFPGQPQAQKDLDFLLSIFSGKDNTLHAVVAESFSSSLPKDLHITAHTIPDSEAQLGGCNIADLRGGEVLIAPHIDVAPTTNAILDEYALADVIKTPAHFLSGGGGPRCSISSFSI